MNILLVLLSVLKFLFIALLIIIGIFVFLIGIILLVPIKYKILLKTDDLFTKKTDFYAVAEITWLLKILKINFKYKEKKKKIKLSIFGITIIGKDKKIKEINETEPNKKNSIQKKEQSINTIKISDNKGIEEIEKKPTSTKIEVDIDICEKPEELELDDEIENFEDDLEDHTDTSYKKESFRDKATKMIEKAKYFYNHEDKDAIIEATKKITIRFFNALKPQKLSLTGEFGLSDPSTTGIIIGITSAISKFYRLNILLKGNFQKKILALKLNIVGKLTLGEFVWCILAFGFTKPIFKIIKQFLFKKTGRKKNNE